MREYLQISNLKRAAILGGVVAFAGVPRVAQTDAGLAVLVPSAFLLMTLVAGAVTAWGQKGGMVGAFPPQPLFQRGLVTASIVGLVFGVGRIFWGDDELRQVLLASEHSGRFELSFPSTVSGKLALVLWVAGFQVLFFQAGAMSFLSRIFGRWEYALIALGFLRVFVTHLQFEHSGVPPIASAYLFSTLATLIGATVFARCGFMAAVVFAALLELRLLCL